MLDLIAFDADDTLWHNETLYSKSQEGLKELLSAYMTPQEVEKKLFETEMGNLHYFGYGIKSFTLSMIEAAIQISEGRIPAGDIHKIIGFAKNMLDANVQLFDHVEDTLAQLAESYPLMLVTKGDLLDQEAKVARSGLAGYFRFIEIVSDKNAGIYASILERYKIDPRRFMMVGNSLKSDVLPVLELGGHAVYVPYHLTWVHENMAGDDHKQAGYYEIEHLGMLPDLIENLGAQ